MVVGWSRYNVDILPGYTSTPGLVSAESVTMAGSSYHFPPPPATILSEVMAWHFGVWTCMDVLTVTNLLCPRRLHDLLLVGKDLPAYGRDADVLVVISPRFWPGESRLSHSKRIPSPISCTHHLVDADPLVVYSGSHCTGETSAANHIIWSRWWCGLSFLRRFHLVQLLLLRVRFLPLFGFLMGGITGLSSTEPLCSLTKLHYFTKADEIWEEPTDLYWNVRRFLARNASWVVGTPV